MLSPKLIIRQNDQKFITRFAVMEFTFSMKKKKGLREKKTSFSPDAASPAGRLEQNPKLLLQPSLEGKFGFGLKQEYAAGDSTALWVHRWPPL